MYQLRKSKIRMQSEFRGYIKAN